MSEQRAIFDELNIQDICDIHCPLECDNTLYSTTVSSAKYPTDYYWDIIKYQANILSMSTTLNIFQPAYLVSILNLDQNEYDDSYNATTTSINSLNLTKTTVSISDSNQTTTNAANAAVPVIINSVADDSTKSTILMLSVYYDDLRYSLIEEAPAIDFQTLIGIIGILLI